MPRAAYVVSPGQSPEATELARTIVHELALQNVPGELHTAFPPAADDQVYVWVDPVGYLAAEGAHAAPDPAALRRTVMLFDEHRIPDAGDVDLLALIRGAGGVFCLDPASLTALHQMHLPARLLRPGFSDRLDGFVPGEQRPIDVVFVGTRTPRRVQQLERAAPVLERYRTELHLLERDPGTGAVIGEMPDVGSLMRQSKLVLNLHATDASDLEWRRVLDAIQAGAVVVSEHASALAPLIAGRHLLVASGEALPFVAESLLRNPERMEQVRLEAHERLKSWVPFALPISVLRAALVEAVGAPIALGAQS